MYAELTPAYGRDYTKKADVLKDWEANKDFILNDMMSRYDGKPINKTDFASANYSGATIRYGKLRKVLTVKA